MNNELEEIKKKKLEQLKKQYVDRGKKMSENMPDKPIKMSDADLDQYVQKYNKVVIDCWAPWCGPCRMIHPIIDELSKEKKGEIVFGKLNVDENQQTAMKYQIMSIPSLLVFKDGKLVDKIIGAMPKEILEQKLFSHY